MWALQNSEKACAELPGRSVQVYVATLRQMTAETWRSRFTLPALIMSKLFAAAWNVQTRRRHTHNEQPPVGCDSSMTMREPWPHVVRDMFHGLQHLSSGR